jgi:high affinity Mn2+ porin
MPDERGRLSGTRFGARIRLRVSLIVAAMLLFGVASLPWARAEVAEPSGRADEAFDFMNFLARRGLHDLDNEAWNAYGQITDIWSLKLAFPAKYTNFNGSNGSLSNSQELGFTETATFFLGLRLWPGGEAYAVPELIAEKPLSGLRGLGSTIQNFELQKTGARTPSPYLSRVYLRHTFDLGGGREAKTSDPMQLGGTNDRRRVVLTAGNFSILDFFDKNSVAGDLRRSFFNMAFLTYAAYDFAADARGYAWGGVAEVIYDDWGIRFGRFTPPQDPNQLPLDFRLDKYYGDQLEVEHTHRAWGREGVVRVLGYQNVENMGRFADAVAAYRADPTVNNAASCDTQTVQRFNYGSTNKSAPDLCFVRKTHAKIGAGLSVEQSLTPAVGVFFRGMYSDGETEVFSYTSTDRSISVGSVVRGSAWRRSSDTVGLGWSEGWISKDHADYLSLGGVDGFIGDGKLRQASEGVLEVFYSLSLGSSSWASVDYQHIWNPAYNADRGPVDIFGGRVHAEF